MKKLVTTNGPVAAAQMAGDLIEKRLLDRIRIQVMEEGQQAVNRFIDNPLIK
jgi:hypothetical protein